MKLRIEKSGAAELMGTSRVMVKTTRPEVFNQNGLILRNGSRECAAIADVEPYDEDIILMDYRFFAFSLKCEEEQFIEVEPVHLVNAREVRIEGSYGNFDAVEQRVSGKAFVQGQSFPLYIGDVPRQIHIASLQPRASIVREETRIQYKKVKTAEMKEASSLKEEGIEEVHWDDIGGLKEAKREIQDNIIDVINDPEFFEEMGISPERGFLFHGAPGVGKTLIAKAIATECKINFISESGAKLKSKWFGESEKNIREVFEKARKNAPCILCFDEIDDIVPQRSGDSLTNSLVNQFLAEMDGIRSLKNVFVIGTTNREDRVDKALTRSGRFYPIEIGFPTKEERKEIFLIHLKKKRYKGRQVADDVNVNDLVERSDQLAGSDISKVIDRAIHKFAKENKDNNKVIIPGNYYIEEIERIKEKAGIAQNKETGYGFSYRSE